MVTEPGTEADPPESRAIVRLGWWIALLTIVGASVSEWWGGPRWALGFTLGAVASYWNFRALKNIVDRLAQPNAPGRGIRRVLLRFLLLGLGAFAILRYSELNVLAALTGLFVSAAAVILEILLTLAFPDNL